MIQIRGPQISQKLIDFYGFPNFETHPYFTKHSEMSPRLEGHGHDLSLYPIGGGEFPNGVNQGKPLGYLMILNSAGNPPSIRTYIHTLPYLTLPYLTLPDITLHYITLHYITLHYIQLIYECKICIFREKIVKTLSRKINIEFENQPS